MCVHERVRGEGWSWGEFVVKMDRQCYLFEAAVGGRELEVPSALFTGR